MAKKKKGEMVGIPGMGNDNKAHVSVSWPEGKSPDLSKCRIGKQLSVNLQGTVSSMSQDEFGSRVSLAVTPKQLALGSTTGDLKNLRKGRRINNGSLRVPCEGASRVQCSHGGASCPPP